MSIRSDVDISPQLQQTLSISPQQINAATAASSDATQIIPAPTETQLHSANSFHNTNEAHPLNRTVVVNIRASLNDLCLKRAKATWSPPSSEATRAIFQQAFHRP